MEKKTFLNEYAISIMAAIVSICALLVSFYQTNIMREQQYASVKPLVLVGNSMDTNPSDSTGRSELIIWNKGIGPAMIKYVNFEYNGENFSEFQVQRLVNKMLHRTDSIPIYMTVSTATFSPISASDHITMINIADKKFCYLFNMEYFNAFNNKQLNVTVYFTDIYDRLYKTSLRKSKIVPATQAEIDVLLPKEMKTYFE
jgi:hypothetical protein